ncbi:MAG: InlB B-repeat-containing protein [Culicoidibacterales bacterium]
MRKIKFIMLVGMMLLAVLGRDFGIEAASAVGEHEVSGGIGWDEFHSIKNTTDGGEVISGLTQSKLPGEVRHGSTDGWIVKKDANGVIMFSRQYGTAGADFIYGTEQTSDGGYISAGMTDGVVSGGTNFGGMDAWILKTDSQGNASWARQFGGTSTDRLSSIKQVNDGGYITVGWTDGVISGTTNLGQRDGIITKYDANGNRLWIKTVGGAGNDELTTFVQTSDGEFIALGETSSTLPGQTGKGGSDGWAIKFDTDGNIKWSKQYGTAGVDRINAADVTADGHVIAAGYVTGALLEQTALGLEDAWLLKIDIAGNISWSKQYGTGYSEKISGMKTSNKGNYVLAGRIEFGMLPGETYMGGGNDGIVLKINEDGTQAWHKQAGTSKFDMFTAITQKATGDFVVTGITTGVLPGAAALGSYDGWEYTLAQRYALNFSLNGGTGTSPATQELAYDQLATLPTTPTKVGSTFVGWNTMANGTGINWNFPTTKMGEADVTLYAQWQTNSHKLSFNLNGESGTVPTVQTIDYGGLATMPSPPLKTGYRFTGWDTVADGSGTNWDFNSTEMPDNDVVLYAQWSINSYNLRFNINGGLGTPPPSQTLEYANKAVSVTAPQRTGYTFLSWNTSIDGSGDDWNFGTTVMPENDITLYAQWSINSYTLSYNVNGGTSITPVGEVIVFGQRATAPAVPIRQGYHFVGWDTAANGAGTAWDFSTTTMPNNNVTLYAQWVVNSHELVFDINGGGGTSPQVRNVEYGALVAAPDTPQRAGYQFSNWNIALDGSGSVWNFGTTTMPDNNVTLYAQWTVNSYTLNYDVNGGTSTPPASQMVNFGAFTTEPAAPVRVGYNFIGWDTAADGSGIGWDFITTPMPTNNVTLYAQWSLSNNTLNFNINGGEGLAPPGQIITFGEYGQLPPAPQRVGYSFTGWNTAANGSGTLWAFETMPIPVGGVILYAQWTINTYNLSFEVNGATSTVPPIQQINYDQLAVEPDLPLKLGYSFTGWDSALDGSGSDWNFSTTKMPAANTVLYAQWNINRYVLSFHLNGGVGIAPTAQSIVYDGNGTVPDVPQREGHTFVSWNTLQDGSGTDWYLNAIKMPAANTTLYAEWIKNSYQISFDLNGAGGSAPTTQTVEYGGYVTAPPNPVKQGYSFSGWNTAEDGSGAAWDFLTSPVPNTNIRLYGQWEKNSYQMTFDINGGTGSSPTPQIILYDEYGTLPSQPDREGYTFLGWNANIAGASTTWDFATTKMPDQNVVLVAQWQVNIYQISYDLNGFDAMPPGAENVPFGSLAEAPENPLRPGYTFISWDTEADGSGTEWDFASTRMFAQDVTLYAQWSINSYTVSFNTNEADGITPLTQQKAYGQHVDKPSDPIKAGYRLLGWSETADGSDNLWKFTIQTMPANNITLYAQWKKIDEIKKHKVYFDLAGGSGDILEIDEVVEGQKINKPADPTKQGYKFIGWQEQQKTNIMSKMSTASPDLWDFENDRMPANDIRLMAVWEANNPTTDPTPTPDPENPENPTLPTTGKSDLPVIVGAAMTMTGLFLLLRKKIKARR